MKLPENCYKDIQAIFSKTIISSSTVFVCINLAGMNKVFPNRSTIESLLKQKKRSFVLRIKKNIMLKIQDNYLCLIETR